MFDVSFGELLLVLVIALIVLGPARLPEAIKTVANWIKALRRLSASVQLELSRELKLQELQDSLAKAETSGLDNITPEIKASIDDLKRVTDSIQKEFYDTANDVKATVNNVDKDKSTPVTDNSNKDIVDTQSNNEIGTDHHVGR